jgi:membrane protease YdiL (CAAX protease family)
MTADPAYGLQQELRPKAPRWGVWATIGWGAVIAAIYLTTMLVAASGFIFWWESTFPEQPLDFANLASNGPLLATVTPVANLAAIGVVILAVWLSHVQLANYLALKWPSRQNFLIGLLLTVLMLLLADLITIQSGREVIPEFMTDAYETSGDAGIHYLILLGLTLVVFAPLGEEIVFRGFFFRGLNTSLGPLLTILITSLVWAGMHAQYDAFFMTQIFVFGLVLGWMRWRSESLILVIVLHALINTTALLQTTLELGA